MDFENINYNEVLISGNINYIKKLNQYIAFGLTCKTFSNTKSKCFINFHIYDDLYNIYKDLFFKNNKLFVKGYLNSYTDKDNKIASFVKVTDVSNNPEDIIKGRKAPYIRYDEDNIMVWNGKRCEATPFEKDDPQYLRLVEMLKEFE